MRKYLMGGYDCWLRAEPQELITKCWHPYNDARSIYNIHCIFIFEDDKIIKTLNGSDFATAWKDHCKVVDFDGDVARQFYDFLEHYIRKNT
jgi:hypothetical protein